MKLKTKTKSFSMILMMLLIGFFISSALAKDAEIKKVIVVPVTMMHYTDEIKNPYSGIVKASREIDVISPKMGTIEKINYEKGDKVINYKEGDIVKEGDVLVEIVCEGEMGNLTIKSPIDGVVSKIYKNVKELVMPGDKLIKVIDINKVLLDINVPGKDIDKVVLGQNIRFKIAAYSDKELYGEIYNILPEISKDGKLKAQAIVDNADLKLLPGMSAEIWLKYYDISNALVIPTKALLFSGIKNREENFYTIYVLGDKKQLEAREVTVEHIKEDYAHISGDITVGELVIIDSDSHSAKNLKIGQQLVIEKVMQDMLLPDDIKIKKKINKDNLEREE